ncbi:hypothetical protein [Mycolicibacterium sp. XJ870]
MEFVPEFASDLFDAARTGIDNALGALGSPPEIRIPATPGG